MDIADLKIDEQDRHHIEEVRWQWCENGWYYSSRESTVYLHREILGISGDQHFIVQFKNGDRSDCRRENLELVPMGQHVRSMRKTKAKGYSYKHGRSKPWEARISHKGKVYYLGSFAEEEEAKAAYQLALWRISKSLNPN